MNTFEWAKAYFRSEDRSLHETKATMAALMTYADFHDLTCYPSQRTLARITGTHVDTVRRHLKKNIEAGWLQKIREGSSYKSTNKYQLTVPTPCVGAGSQESPHRDAGTTPRTGAGSTPYVDAPLTDQETTQGTNQVPCSGTTQESGSTTEPLSGSGDISFGEHERVQRSSTNQETPRTGAGSAPRTDAEPALASSRPVTRERKPLPWELPPTWPGLEPRPRADAFVAGKDFVDPFADN